MPDLNELAPGDAQTLSEIAFLAGLAIQTSGAKHGPRHNWRKIYAYIARRWGWIFD